MSLDDIKVRKNERHQKIFFRDSNPVPLAAHRNAVCKSYFVLEEIIMYMP